jgi:hypothetical protein
MAEIIRVKGCYIDELNYRKGRRGDAARQTGVRVKSHLHADAKASVKKFRAKWRDFDDE